LSRLAGPPAACYNIFEVTFMKSVLKIGGMTCGGCRAGVLNAIKKVPGVISAEVSLEKGEASVEYDEKKTALSELKAAVENAGFTAG